MSFLEYEVTSRLDAAGDWKASIPVSDPRAANLAVGKVLLMYGEQEGFIDAGIINEMTVNQEQGVLELSGCDMLGQLRYITTLDKSLVSGKAFNAAVQAILGFRSETAAWVATDNTAWAGPGTIQVRFDSETILEALIKTAQVYRGHIRKNITESAGVLTKRVAAGTFGANSGVTLVGGSDVSMKLGGNVKPVTSLIVRKSGNEIWNRLIIKGTGNGDGQFSPRYHDISSSLLVNPSFERDLANWTFTGGQASNYTRDGTIWCEPFYSLKMSGSGATREMHQQISGITAGQAYTFELMVHCNASFGVARTIATLEYRSATNTVLESADLQLTWAAAGWKVARKINWTAPTDTTQVRIRLRKPTAPTDLWFDRVRFFKADSSVGNDSRDLYSMPWGRFGSSSENVLVWFIEDSASQATYGVRERVINNKNLNMQDGQTANVRAASSALLWWATRYLAWSAYPQTTYELGEIIELPLSVKPGDKVRLRWRGVAEHWSGKYVYLDEDVDLWVLERTDSKQSDGVRRTKLVVSNIDRPPQDSDLETLLSDSEGVSQWRRIPQGSGSRFQNPLPLSFTSSGTRSFRVDVGPDTYTYIGAKFVIEGPNITNVKVDGVSILEEIESGGTGGTGGSGGGGGSGGVADIVPWLMDDLGITIQGEHLVEVTVSAASTVQVVGTVASQQSA